MKTFYFTDSTNHEYEIKIYDKHCSIYNIKEAAGISLPIERILIDWYSATTGFHSKDVVQYTIKLLKLKYFW
jgi:hypothetical protein